MQALDLVAVIPVPATSSLALKYLGGVATSDGGSAP